MDVEMNEERNSMTHEEKQVFLFKKQKRTLDCFLERGAITKALETATGAKLKVLGKPDPGILIAAAARKNVPIGECLMIGDRLATDIAVGVNAGAMTCRINGPGADLTPAEGVVPDLETSDLGGLQKIWEDAEKE